MQKHGVKEQAHGVLQTIRANFLPSFFLIGLVIGAGTAYGIIDKDTTSGSQSVSTYTVALGDIENTIKAYGSAELVDEQTLRFNQQGEVIAVYVKAGDEVTKGTIIAELDKDTVLNEIEQAKISLETAQLQLQEVLEGNEESQILKAENELEQAELKYELAQEEYRNLMTEKENYIANQVKSITSSSDNNQKTIDSTHLEIKNRINDAELNLDKLDNFFGARDATSTLYKTIEVYLSAKKTSLKQETKVAIMDAYQKLDVLTQYYNASTSLELDEESLLLGLNAAKELFDATYDAAQLAYDAMDNTIVSVNLTQNTIDGYLSTINSISNSAKSTLATIISTKNQISNLNSMENIKNDYEQQLKQYDVKLQSSLNDLRSQQNNLVILEQQLADLKEGSTYEQIRMAENTVLQRQLSLQKTEKDLENLQLEAPFDGVVRKVDFKVGDKITSDESKYVYLENPDLIEVSVLLDQVDIVEVEEGMTVEVELDAYPDVVFEGVIGEIDTTPSVSAGVVSYTVTVSIDKGDKKIYSGMTATVKIIVEKKENIILVPTSYIQSMGDRKIVLDGSQKPISVEVGSTDGNMTEIISGLQEGDIISKQTTTTTAAASSYRNSGVPMGGGMGGGMRFPR